MNKQEQQDYPLDKLFEMSSADLKQFYQDLTTKHLITDFYQLTAGSMDPKTESIIVLEPQTITDKTSKEVINQSYQESINTINQLNEDYNYPTKIEDETLPIIIFQEKQTDPKQPVKIRQVIPFNLWLGFSMPIAVSNPHILQEPLLEQMKPLVRLYVENLLINWLNIPWLLYYKLNNNQDLTTDQLYQHSIANYQINLFDSGIDIEFDIQEKNDQDQFKNFLKSQKWPNIVKFNPGDNKFYQLQINHQS